ncbi:MAG TPA: hypothetical protein VFF67_03820 [Thermoplasmata archaeon]|nr:hypothetical protein [Thermoplasmata archaeon]
MTLKEICRIALPAHRGEGGFDHAAVDSRNDRLYVAHPSNDCVEVVDLEQRRHLHSLRSLKGVAGVWVSEPAGLLFTSNRGEDTTSIFELPAEREIARFPTGRRPNGIAFDPQRHLLAIAGVGASDGSAPPSVTFFDLASQTPVSQVTAPGRTRWAMFHPPTDAFYVNIADPPGIAQFRASDPSGVARCIEVPARGPHGLEAHADGQGLYFACDDGRLVTVELPSGRARVVGKLAGAPDVLWSNRARDSLYVAIGEPGVVQVFDTRNFEHVETIPTADDAHTLTLDPRRNAVHVFLPGPQVDLVLRESPGA